MGTVLGLKDGESSGSDTLEITKGIGWIKRQFSKSWYVLASTSETEAEVMASTGIPPIGYPTNSAWAKKQTAKEETTVVDPSTGSTMILWAVTVDFDSDVDAVTAEGGDSSTPPEARRPQIRWDYETEDEALIKDVITGDLVATLDGIGEPLTATYPVIYPILEITRYEVGAFDPTVNGNYGFRLNSQSFWGAPYGSALLYPVASEEEIIEGELYSRCTYKIKFHVFTDQEEPFKLRLLHHGNLHFKDFQAAFLKSPSQFRDAQGTTRTINLDDRGMPLTPGEDPHYLEFNRYKFANINALSLGPF